jgi:hypothetical protein
MKILRHIIVPAGLSLAASLPATAVVAQERLGDGAMGALAGAVVLGPVGLLAGGVIGYTAGPGIADSWGVRHHRHYYRHARYHRPRQ